MEKQFTCLFFSFVLFLLLSNSAAVDTLTANQAIRDGHTIVSAGEMYELGFFSPGKSKNRYLGIWYKKMAPGTVVWVANRETPLTDFSGVLKVSNQGTLLLFNGSNNIIWSSNSSLSAGIVNPVAKLLDTGNLVVSNKSSFDGESFIWQSFDYPGDTLLAGMKFGSDLVRGIDRRLTSWKSADDPSPGQYLDMIDINGFPQIFVKQGLDIRFRLGPWNGLTFSGTPCENPSPIYSIEFVFNEKEIYYKYELKSSVVQRIVLKSDGSLVQLYWIERSKDWFVYANGLVDTCGRYGVCGPYGSCNINNNPVCTCMDGFVPKRPEDWNRADWSSGCQLKSPLGCGDRDGFHKISRVKFPDTRHSWYNRSMSLWECEIACRRNCSCTAYANLDVRNGGSGCLLWFGELMDLRVCEEKQDLYIRMPTSLLPDVMASRFGSSKKQTLILTLPISSLVLVLLAVYACNKKRSPAKKRGSRVHVQEEDLDLPCLSFSEISKATNNFSVENKLGEGGFGSVYKGVLEEGQEIAVKRLSETSQQGLDELQNEVICIAKLQHRNLVKLIGYCIQKDERILIYEYMPNKSLNCFLFDESRRSILGWAQRFNIIHGIARGLLYLHEDSRLQIIHRDLKADNILLDVDMNPKISDFGLARMFSGKDAAAKTKRVVGTYGYISPEYAVHGRFSVKSDVFSFGVLVLEIVSGKKNREFSHDDHRDNLLGHAWRLYKEDKSLELMCPSLRNSFNVSEVLRSIHVGLLCVQQYAEDRPTMLSVVLMLVSEGPLPPPKPPAFFTEEYYTKCDSFPSVDTATITLLHPR